MCSGDAHSRVASASALGLPAPVPRLARPPASPASPELSCRRRRVVCERARGAERARFQRVRSLSAHAASSFAELPS